jgi:hypothetical protein
VLGEVLGDSPPEDRRSRSPQSRDRAPGASGSNIIVQAGSADSSVSKSKRSRADTAWRYSYFKTDRRNVTRAPAEEMGIPVGESW